MTGLRALNDNEVYLDSSYFPIKGRVEAGTVDQFPQKTTIGKANRSDQTVADEWVQDEWKAGMLRDQFREDSYAVNPLTGSLQASPDFGRFWWSSADTTRRRKMVLPPLVTSVGNPAGNGSSKSVLRVIYFAGSLYAIVGTAATDCKLYKQTSGSGAWSASLGTICSSPNIVTDVIVYNSMILMAYGAAYATYDGTTFDASGGVGATRASYFTLYDSAALEKIAKVDDTGYVVASQDGLTWSATFYAQIPGRTPTGILAYRDVNNNPLLLVQHTYGQVTIDLTEHIVQETGLQVLDNADNGKGAIVWSDTNLYYPNGQAVWQYTQTGGTITNVGLDRDDGLPSFLRGRITKLERHPQYLIAALNAPTVTITDPEYMYFALPELPTTFMPYSADAGFSAVLSWNSVGWHILYLSGQQSYGINTLFLTTKFSNERRLYFNDGPLVKYIILPEGNYDPTTDATYAFANTATFMSSDFDGGFTEQRKIATSLKFRALHVTTTEYVDVYYALDGSETFAYVGRIDSTTVNSAGRVRFVLGTSSRGVSFYTIRLKLILYRGTDSSKSPVLVFFGLRYKVNPFTILGWKFKVFGVDISHLEDLWVKLVEAKDNETLIDFLYKAEQTEPYVVKITRLGAVEYSANASTASYDVTLTQIEPDE